jgi:hypothetical protein
MKLLFFIWADKLIPFHDQIKGQLAWTEVDIITARRAGNQQAIDTNEKIKKRLLSQMNIISALVQYMGSSADDD